MKTDEETRKKILNAAHDVFNEYGPVKTTLTDVARQAGISKSLIYYYFKDKNELFREVVIEMVSHFIAEVREDVMREKTAAKRLQVLMTVRFERLTRAAARRKASLERSLEYYPIFHSLMDLFRDGETGLMQEVIDFGNDRGEFCVEDSYAWSRQMAMVLLAMDHQIFMNAVEGVMDETAWAMIVDTIIRGLLCEN